MEGICTEIGAEGLVVISDNPLQRISRMLIVFLIIFIGAERENTADREVVIDSLEKALEVAGDEKSVNELLKSEKIAAMTMAVSPVSYVKEGAAPAILSYGCKDNRSS